MNTLVLIFSVFVSAIYVFRPSIGYTLKDDACIVSQYDDVANATQNCTNIILSNLSVPAGMTLLLNLQDGATVTFRGNIIFEYVNWAGPLVRVYGNRITVQGEEGHILNGQGELYWDGVGSWGSTKPKFFAIEANESVFRNLHIYNAPMHGIAISNSRDVIFTDFFIDNSAGDPGVALSGHEGHNTDGFGVARSSNIIITNSTIYNQDDCVALNSGSNIWVSNLLCHGSHGLSISVGFSNTSTELNSLTNVIIENSTIIDGMDGIHIKTHINAGVGEITNVIYRNIFMSGSYDYGIAIEQNYTNSPANSTDNGAAPKGNIPIRGLKLQNIKGTVLNTSIPYYVVCAQEACSNWIWDDVNVSGHLDSACVNFHPDGIECVDYTV